jgi:hypothetical protein
MHKTYVKVFLVLLKFGLANLQKYSCRNFKNIPDFCSQPQELIPAVISGIRNVCRNHRNLEFGFAGTRRANQDWKLLVWVWTGL